MSVVASDLLHVLLSLAAVVAPLLLAWRLLARGERPRRRKR
ncbi:MAG: hypothetical protein ABI887_05785 [Burkholderiales bacterium]